MLDRNRGRLAAVAALLMAGAGVAALGVAGPAGAATSQPSVVSANPADFTPQVKDGEVKAIIQVGSTIVLGGKFTTVTNANGSQSYTRSNIVAFDATTGAVSTTFKPTFGGAVEALAAGDNNSVYVAGGFSTVNGASSTKVVRLSLATGSKVSGFAAPSINGTVRDMKRVGARLYIGGSFSTVGGQSRLRMASLDAATGALTSFLNVPFTGVNSGGATTVSKFEVAPDGSKLVAIGNFATVAGQPRSQIAMLDLSGASAALSSWATDRYPNVCSPQFNTYMRDVDFAPDSSYFVVSTTGAYHGTDTLCDTITRWPSDATGSGQQPYWVAYTGGDTTYAVTATGTAVYAGGHMRWLNNPFAGDAAGPGAVPREGIVALDPKTGLPFTWNPGRSRGVGVFDMLATSQGLWVGSDTTRIGNETHARIALMPLAGGKTIPAVTTPTLPGTVVQLGRTGTSTDASVLYRVNAGGPALLSADDGPDWSGDTSADSPYRDSGSNNVDAWNQTVTRDASVPSTTNDRAPQALFDSERWGASHWTFPVPSGTPVTVRLYFANQCGCTSAVGSRVFNVSIDGSTVLPNFDMVAAKGDRVGFMDSFDTTSDGVVNIDFDAVQENPLINGIEIIDDSVTPGSGTSGSDDVRSTSLAANGTAGSTTTVAGSDAFHLARGAFVVGSTLYTPWADGTLKARAINTNGTFGTVRTVNLYNGPFATDAANVTGIAFDPASNRIYYTMNGSNELYWRWFTPESEVVGAQRFTADAGALNPSDVRGMFITGGKLYYAQTSDGDLYSVPFNGGVTGAATLVNSSRSWTAPGMTLR